MQDKVIK